jgi:hypothetical protein
LLDRLREEYLESDSVQEDAMRFASISFALLLAPTFALAQNSGRQPPLASGAVNLSPAMTARMSTLTGACPVGLQAQRRGTTSMVTIDGKLQRESGPTVRLMINNLQGKEIVGATVSVRGYDARPQLFLVSATSSAPELSKTVTLKLNVAGGKNGETDLTMTKFGSVSRIYLQSLDYADGTEWQATMGRSCYVEPDLLVLVADK